MNKPKMLNLKEFGDKRFQEGFQKSQEMIREEIEKLFEKEIRDKKYGISEVLAITFYKNKLLSKIGGKE